MQIRAKITQNNDCRCWVDESDNMWDCNVYIKSEASRHSLSMMGCHNCKDCKRMVDCKNCIRSKNCTNCIRCTGCTACSNCLECFSCFQCENSTNKYRLVRHRETYNAH